MMRNYEIKFDISGKGFFGCLEELSTHTQIIAADSERDAKKRLEAMYSDKNVRIRSCRIVY